MNNPIRIILIIIIIFLVIYLIYNYNNNNYNNINNNNKKIQQSVLPPQNTEKFISELPKNINEPEMPEYLAMPSIISDNESTLVLPADLNSKYNSNHALPGQYKSTNYADGRRGNNTKEGNSGEWEKYFDNNNMVLDNNNIENNQYMPIDEAQTGFASYSSNGKENKKDCAPEDLFDVDQYLPVNEKNDWWDSPGESIDVKNRHLINLNRSIGVDTIGSSNRNSSYDIRGEPPNPKYLVSAFNNSSIDPKIGFKPLS